MTDRAALDGRTPVSVKECEDMSVEYSKEFAGFVIGRHALLRGTSVILAGS